jgi:hypothetical protein
MVSSGTEHLYSFRAFSIAAEINVKILILHGIDRVEDARRTSLHHAFFPVRHMLGHEFWLQSAASPISTHLMNQSFDAILLDATFLCWRWASHNYDEIRLKFDFIRDLDAVKIAFPQDEYDHSKILGQWLTDWNVNIVYSIFPDQKDTLYPDIAKGVEFRQGYTGFIEPEDFALMSEFATAWSERSVDVGYRARRLPPYFGWFGKLKADIADNFQRAAAYSGLRLDISCRPEDAFPGDNWLRFLGNCRFILGCESGSSILDPSGEIRKLCNDYLASHPAATFEDVKNACLIGIDRREPFSAISPRLFEAAAAGCVQLLIPAKYAGILEPWKHYLPLYPDASNLSELLPIMRDEARMRDIIEASQDALLRNPRFNYKGYAMDVTDAIIAQRLGHVTTPLEYPFDQAIRLALKTEERWAKSYEDSMVLLEGKEFNEFQRKVNILAELGSKVSSHLSAAILLEESFDALRAAKNRLAEKLK